MRNLIIALCALAGACYPGAYAPPTATPLDAGRTLAGAACAICGAACVASCAVAADAAKRAKAEERDSKISDAIDRCAECSERCLKSCGESLK